MKTILETFVELYEDYLKTIPRQQITAAAEAAWADHVEYSKQPASDKVCLKWANDCFKNLSRIIKFFIHFVSALGTVKEDKMSLIYSLSSNHHLKRWHLYCFHLAPFSFLRILRIYLSVLPRNYSNNNAIVHQEIPLILRFLAIFLQRLLMGNKACSSWCQSPSITS